MPTTFTEHPEPAGLRAGVVATSRFYVPAGQHLLATATDANLGTATVQPGFP